MGYDYFKNFSREDAILRALQSCETEYVTVSTVKHRIVGDILWILRKTRKKCEDSCDLNWIECVILDQSDYGWGFKRLSEVSCPYYYSCPIEWLALAPVTCIDWRREVIRQYTIRVL